MTSHKEKHQDKLMPRQYSDSISKRRKALFLNVEPRDNQHLLADDLSESFKPLEIVHDDDDLLRKSNYTILGKIDVKRDDTEAISPPKSVIEDTPHKLSPTQKLKTPNETSSDKSALPRLVRKSLLEESCKRLNNSVMSPEESLENQPSKIAKIRTALFPDDESLGLPTKSFYSNPKPNVEFGVFKKSVLVESNERLVKKKSRKSRPNKRSFGLINAGVRHKIKRPKKRPLKTEALLKAALNIIDNSPLTEYINCCKNDADVAPAQVQTQQHNADSYSDNKQSKSTFVLKINTDFPGRKRPHESHDGAENENQTETETETKRKFFKSSRPKTITVDKDLNIVLDKSITSPKADKSHLSSMDFSQNEFENDLPIADILSMLDDKENVNNDNNAPNVPRNDANLMSPTSQMCDLTLGLAINSPKKARLDISKIFETSDTFITPSSDAPADANGPKYFPIFTSARNPDNFTDEEKKHKNKGVPLARKWRALPKDQMLLDAGQKRFGVTHCAECNTVYNMGDPNDELMHLNYHNAVNTLRFGGWKNEIVVHSDPFYKIVKVSPGDSKLWWKKVHDVLQVVNRDLGFHDLQMNTHNSQVYFYVKNRQILGCLVAEPVSTAFKMLEMEGDVDVCSRESYPVKCGVSRIWVKSGHRREGIATKLMSALRGGFMFANILKRTDLAFSSPTTDGKLFAKKYCDSPTFFVYM